MAHIQCCPVANILSICNIASIPIGDYRLNTYVGDYGKDTQTS